MSENFSDLIEAKLNTTSQCGWRAGLQWVENWLKEESGKAFVQHKDEAAKLLRVKAGTIHQEIELMNVRIQKLKVIEAELEKLEE